MFLSFMLKRLAWVLLSVGLLLTVISGALLVSQLRSMERVVVVPAKVVDRINVVTYGINRYRPVVAFQTLAGEELEFVAMSTLKDEEGVFVAYPVENPRDARIYYGFGENLVAFVLLLLGLVSCGIGGAALKVIAAETTG